MNNIEECPVCGKCNTRNTSARTCNDPNCVALSKKYTTMLTRIKANKVYDHGQEMLDKFEKGKLLTEEERLVALSTLMQER